jgi:hypothetical protein
MGNALVQVKKNSVVDWLDKLILTLRHFFKIKQIEDNPDEKEDAS